MGVSQVKSYYGTDLPSGYWKKNILQADKYVKLWGSGAIVRVSPSEHPALERRGDAQGIAGSCAAWVCSVKSPIVCAGQATMPSPPQP